MKVFVKTLKGTHFEIQVKPEDTVARKSATTSLYRGEVNRVRAGPRRKDRNVVNGDGDGVIGDGIYAMKVMKKDTIIKNNHVDYMKAERDILTKVIHPFVVQLRFSFHTKTKLYLILGFINGGHLFFHLYRQGVFSEDQARVYTDEIVSAVSHLHQRGIVHRDLKPENILMDADGHVMLTDFGLAKEIDESSRSNSMCGTTEYMAPEIILAKGHNKNADWWSVGILLYEMLTGKPPYTHSNRKKLQESFQTVLKEFQKAQRLCAERETSYSPFVPQASLPSRDPGSEIDEGSNNSQEQRALFVNARGQEVLLLDNEIAFNEAIIEEIDQGIQEIQNQIGEVNEIFKDLAVLVHEQGTMIDDIGSNIENSQAATTQARSHLAKASKTQRSNSSMIVSM